MALEAPNPITELHRLLNAATVVDLSWSLVEGGPVFPGQAGFEFEPLGDISDPELPLCFARVSFMEHCGTHMDAPAHVIEGGRYVDQLPFADLVGPACKVDLREHCAGLADFEVSVAHLERHEAAHGRIPTGSIVLLHTGWDLRYATPEDYVVTSRDGGLHWPGVGAGAAELLANRGVRGVGIDTIGLDGGHVAMALAAHRAVLGSGAFIVENVANLADVPPTGALALALPLKTRWGSGGPTRIYALR
ncbi:MAG: cyclase family protein [Solirubrobacteraceae bacterium]